MSKYKINKKRKRYLPGGMYDSNTIPAGIGQNSTSNIVYEETNPEAQANASASFTSSVDKIQQDSTNLASEIERDTQNNAMELQANASNLKNRFGVGEQVLSQGLKTGAKELGFTAGKNMLSEGTKFASSKLGTKFLGTKFAQKQIAKQAAKQGAKRLGETAATASKINPYGIGAVAGKVVSSVADDGDATKWNAGEIVGDVGGAASSGAQFGSMLLPGIGTAIGAVGGALYGLGKGLFQRRKARREQSANEAETLNKTIKGNKEQESNFAQSLTKKLQAEAYGKTYAGFDFGNNMGTKRYGGLKYKR